MRPQFSPETSAHVTAKACHVCSRWLSSDIVRDLNDLRRIHQLLVSSLNKLGNINLSSSELSSLTPSLQSIGQPVSFLNSSVSNDQLIYSELSLTIEKLAVLRGWAELYIVAKHRMNEKKTENTLLDMVRHQLPILNNLWYIVLKDYAYLCLPSGM